MFEDLTQKKRKLQKLSGRCERDVTGSSRNLEDLKEVWAEKWQNVYTNLHPRLLYLHRVYRGSVLIS